MFTRELFVSPEEQRLEWELQFDMTERGRRLTTFKQATEGKVMCEVRPGDWRYVTPEIAEMRRRRRKADRAGEFGVPA
jgi:hypothetical protein